MYIFAPSLYLLLLILHPFPFFFNVFGGMTNLDLKYSYKADLYAFIKSLIVLHFFILIFFPGCGNFLFVDICKSLVFSV